jgi:chromosome segregation ATPase
MMNSRKKTDLKSGLADILMGDDNESSLAHAMESTPSVPVSLSPDHTEIKPALAPEPKASRPKILSKDDAPSVPVVLGSHLAQKRISVLEAEVDRLRTDWEMLSASEEGLKKQVQEVSERARILDTRLREIHDTRSEEVKNSKELLHKKDTELQTAKNRIVELESRLQNDFQRIRVKERELQNRIELMKLESAAVIKSKDDMILELKRQLDQINYEMDSIRKKTQSINQQVEDQQDRIKRSVKALRLAVSLLDGDEAQLTLKKAE